jgi:hypothetical protein
MGQQPPAVINPSGDAQGERLTDLVEAFSVSIPENSAVGNFAVGRPNNSKNQTNTHAFYQDDGGIVQALWQNDTSGWQGPSTYSVFDGGGKGKDVTCLTAAAWDATGAELQSNQDMNWCHFKVEGKVREVHYDGSNWSDKCYLPIT